MKKNIVSVIILTALVVLIGPKIAHADDSKPVASESHGAHHPEGKEAAKTAGMANHGGMMDKMDMGQMKGMMHQCMEMHKDGKMCDHDMMSKCQEKMGKDECQKMMKQAKSQSKTKKK